MLWGWIVGVLLILVIASCLYMPVTMEFEFSRVSGDDEGFVSLRYLFGLIRKRHELKKLDTTMTKEGPAISVQHQGQGTKSKDTHQSKITTKDIWTQLKNWRKWMFVIREAKPIFASVLRHVHVQRLQVDLELGTGDVVTTGTACGAVWSIVGPAIGFFTHACQFDVAPKVHVQPNFKQSMLFLDVSGIISVRAGYAISGAYRILRVLKRRASHGAPNSGSHADSHGQHS